MASITVTVVDDVGNITETTLVGTLNLPVTFDQIRFDGVVSGDGSFEFVAGQTVAVEVDYTDPEGQPLGSSTVVADEGVVGPVADSGTTLSFTWTAP